MNAIQRLPRGLLLVAPALLLVTLLYLVPLLHLGGVSFGEQDTSLAPYSDLFGSWGYAAILWRTFRLSFVGVVGCIALGYPIGYVLAFLPPKPRAFLSLLVLLPFWTSVLVRNFAWIYLLRKDGVLSAAAGLIFGGGEPVQLLYNDLGVLIALVNTLLPFMVLPVFVAIVDQERSLREAASSLGASPARVFFTVTLPLSRNGIFAGSLFVFTSAVGFFITPALLGGGHVLMSATFINQQVEEFVNWPLAAAAAMVLLVIVLVLVALYRRVAGSQMLGADHGAN